MHLFDHQRIERFSNYGILICLLALFIHPFWYMLIPLGIAVAIKTAMAWIG